VETPCPPVSDTGDGDATRPTDEPEPAPAGVEPSLLRRTLLQSNVDIPVDRVSVVGSRRALQEDRVTDIAKSIERHGLVYPILVRIWEDASQPPAADAFFPIALRLPRRVDRPIRHNLDGCQDNLIPRNARIGLVSPANETELRISSAAL
jgi:hypothetical protein